MQRLIFLGVIATFLLGLYSYAVWYSIQCLLCLNAPDSCAHPRIIGEGINTILTLVGGLISALVISVLAITPANDSPAKALIANFQPVNLAKTSPVSEFAKNLTQVLTYAYLLVWLGCGIAAVIYGFVKDYPVAVPELTSAAKSWLGIAVASSYAFFGLKAQ